MIKTRFCAIVIFIFAIFIGCQSNKTVLQKHEKIRGFVDTVGFAHKAWQLDSVLARTYREFGQLIKQREDSLHLDSQVVWKVVISPHDDHAYVSYLYPLLLKHVKAKTLIIFGVAHKAWKFGLRDSLIFGTFDYWRGAYGKIKVSPLRDTLLQRLPEKDYIVHDSMMAVEHSIEAFLPYLQKLDRKDIEIVPILVPYMKYERMKQIANDLADVLVQIVKSRHWQWGKDFAIIISTDAVHYGDQGWGGANLAYYGADSAGYRKAVKHEYEIISTIVGELDTSGIHQFVHYTVQDTNYMKYRWTWCGRYSVPFGLLTSFYLSKKLHEPLRGVLVGYANSIDHKMLEVKDLGMDTTAVANIHHWVGYAAIGYR